MKPHLEGSAALFPNEVAYRSRQSRKRLAPKHRNSSPQYIGDINPLDLSMARQPSHLRNTNNIRVTPSGYLSTSQADSYTTSRAYDPIQDDPIGAPRYGSGWSMWGDPASFYKRLMRIPYSISGVDECPVLDAEGQEVGNLKDGRGAEDGEGNYFHEGKPVEWEGQIGAFVYVGEEPSVGKIGAGIREALKARKAKKAGAKGKGKALAERGGLRKMLQDAGVSRFVEKELSPGMSLKIRRSHAGELKVSMVGSEKNPAWLVWPESSRLEKSLRKVLKKDDKSGALLLTAASFALPGAIAKGKELVEREAEIREKGAFHPYDEPGQVHTVKGLPGVVPRVPGRAPMVIRGQPTTPVSGLRQIGQIDLQTGRMQTAGSPNEVLFQDSDGYTVRG